MNRTSVEHLDRLVEALQGSVPDQSGRAVADLLSSYAGGHEDWRSFALFDPLTYTRNRVAREQRFELLLLCWGAGHESPIHNHEGQDCWMAVLEGQIEEVRYPMPPPGHVGPLARGQSQVHERGRVAFIRDEIGLHLVRPLQGPAVSLHLYAGPYDECNVYCPETGVISRRRMVDHSVRGRLARA